MKLSVPITTHTVRILWHWGETFLTFQFDVPFHFPAEAAQTKVSYSLAFQCTFLLDAIWRKNSKSAEVLLF